MNDFLRDRLAELFQRFGRGLVNERGRLEAELWLAAGDQSQGIYALFGAIDRKIPHAYLKTPPEHRGPDLDAKLSQRLVDDLDLDAATARWATISWRDAILNAPDQGVESIIPAATPPKSRPQRLQATAAPRELTPADIPDLTIEDVPAAPLVPPSAGRVRLDPLWLDPAKPRQREKNTPSIALAGARQKKGSKIGPGRIVLFVVLGVLVFWVILHSVISLNHQSRSHHFAVDFKDGAKVEVRGDRRIHGHEAAITSVDLHPHLNEAISGSFDKTVRVWNLDNPRQLWRHEGHRAAVLTVAYSPNGAQALSGGLDQTVILWDLEQGREVRRFIGPSGVTSVAFAPDGNTFLAAYGFKDVKQINKAGGDSMQWFPDDPRNGVVILWDVQTGQELKRYLLHTHAVTCVAFLPDGKRAVSGSFDRTLCLFDIDGGKELRRFRGHEAEVFCLAVSPDGKRLLSGSGSLSFGEQKALAKANNPIDNSVRLWDVKTAEVLRVINPHEDLTQSVAFSPGGKRALTAGLDGAVSAWNLNSGDELERFREHNGPVHAARFSPDGQHVLSGGWDSVLRWWRPTNVPFEDW